MPDDRLPGAPLPGTGPAAPAPRLDIAAALSALPLETPERSAWPRLAERIAAAERARRPRPRWPFLLAAVAVLAVVALMPRLQLGGSPSAPVPVAAGAPAAADAGGASLAALMDESARLEHLLAAVDTGSTSASATALGLAFEEQVQRLDSRLADPGLDADTRRALWQRRVALLRDYAGIQGTTQWLAAEGGSHDGELVAVF